MAHRVFTKQEVLSQTAPYAPGDFIVTHGIGVFDRLMQTVTRSTWNHAALIVAADGTIVEALGNGIKQGNISKYQPQAFFLIRVELSDEDRQQVCVYANVMNDRHESYGYLTIAAIALRIVTRLRLVIKIDGTMICSEFVARSLAQGGLIWEKETALITPADLYNAFVAGSSAAVMTQPPPRP